MDGMRSRLAFLLFLGTLQAGADTYPRQPAIDAEHYTFHLVLRDDTDEISGDAGVELRFVKSVRRVLSRSRLRLKRKRDDRHRSDLIQRPGSI